MKSSHKSKSHRRSRDDSLESDSPRPKRAKGQDNEVDSEERDSGNEQPVADNPAITFASCLTEEQKFHLRKKMESELSDLMGEKSTDGASKVVDDMFKEFLAEKMALIEAEKRKVNTAAEEQSGEESESSREEDDDDDDIDAESKSDTAKDSVSTKSGKHKKHKKEKKKKKHKEKDKDRDKSKKHKHKDKERDKDKYEREKHKKKRSDKLPEELSPKDMDRLYEKHRKESYKLDKERKYREVDKEFEKYDPLDKYDKRTKSKDSDRNSEKLSKHKEERSSKSDTVKTEVPLVERGVKHKIHLDADDFIENQVSLSGKESTDDEKAKRKHKHKDKRKDESPDRSKEKATKLKEKEAKVKLEHLDDDEETVGFTEKEEKMEADENGEEGDKTNKTTDLSSESAIDDKDDFKLPQRKVDDDHVSSVFERNISLKMPNIKPLEKYKELKKRGKLAASGLSGSAKVEKKEENASSTINKPEDGKLKKNETADKEIVTKPSKEMASKDNSGKKKGLPDMRLISVLPKRKVEVDENKTVGGTKTPEDDIKVQETDEGRKVENSGNSLVISVNSEGKIQWNDDEHSQEVPPKLDDIPLPIVSPSTIPLPVPPPTQPTSGGETEDGAKKPAMKIKLGSIKISETSAALIQSGLKFDTKKQALLEEGELSGESDVEDAKDEDRRDGVASSSSSSEAADDVTDGEITSSDGETGGSGHKRRKDKKKHKHKKKKKHKEKDKDRSSRRKRTHSRSRTPKKHKHSSRSRSRSPSFDKKRGVWKDRSRSYERDRERDLRGGRRSRSRDRVYPRERDRSRSRERFVGRFHDRGYDRGFRPRSRSPEFYRMRRDFRPPFHMDRYRRRSRSKSPSEDQRLKIDKTKLREIAIANAYRNAKAGRGPDLNLKPDEIAAIKAGGKSIDELTDFCKKIQEKTERRVMDGHESDSELEEFLRQSDDEDAPFIHHPFKVSEKAEIVMNIRNARQLPVLTPADKMAQASTLRLQFPVSSGSQHHAKENEWVSVEKPSGTAGSGAAVVATTPVAATATPAAAAAPAVQAAKVPEDQKVFPDMSTLNVNIGQVVSERLSALRKLQDNPNDSQAITEMYKSQQQMKMWAESKNLPGQFTGSTGVQVLSQAQLAGSTDPKKQAWVKKDTFTSAQPVKEGIGMMLLQRMGWKAGEGLGKNKEGTKEPLMLDFKTDRRGLLASEEQVKKKGSGPFMPIQKDLSGKHPVSGLVELCNKRRWGAPHFTVINETGPDHKKNFLFKVKVNGVEYQPSTGASTKKAAKMQAAAVCLQNLGMIPRDYPLS